MYTIKIDTIKKGSFDINFTNFADFVWIVGHQVGLFHGYVDETTAEDYCNLIGKDFSRRFQEREQLGVYDNIDHKSVVLDIGSGVGIFDIILYKYLGGGTFYLLDKSEVHHGNMTSGQWNDDHGFYNDWNMFKDIINHNDVDASAFITLDPDDEWPSEINLIMSSYSYMWHYSKETYWDKILPYATKDTSLCFDILNHKNNNIGTIEKELNKTCTIKHKPKILFHWFAKDLSLENDSPGKLCYWR